MRGNVDLGTNTRMKGSRYLEERQYMIRVALGHYHRLNRACEGTDPVNFLKVKSNTSSQLLVATSNTYSAAAVPADDVAYHRPDATCDSRNDHHRPKGHSKSPA